MNELNLGIRAALAAMAAAAIGMAQFLYVIGLDVQQGGVLPTGDVAYFFSSLTWLAEGIALIVLALYRFAPWIARLLRDDWEAERILRAKSRRLAIAEWLSVGAILARACIRYLDSGHASSAVFTGAAFALLPLLIPRPKPKPVS